MIFVHGGSLTSEDKNDPPYERLCPAFQAAGIGCANVNYRLARHAKWPAMPKDVAAAVAGVKKNIAVRGGDPKRIFLLGHSSGLPGVDDLRRFTVSERAGALHVRCRGGRRHGCRLNFWNLKDCCMMIEQARPYFEAYPDEKMVFSSIENRVEANPSLYIGKNHVPPFLALVAEAERFQPPILEEAAAFARKLREAGVDADVRILEDRDHMSAIEKMPEPRDAAFGIVLELIGRP